MQMCHLPARELWITFLGVVVNWWSQIVFLLPSVFGGSEFRVGDLMNFGWGDQRHIPWSGQNDRGNFQPSSA